MNKYFCVKIAFHTSYLMVFFLNLFSGHQWCKELCGVCSGNVQYFVTSLRES